MSRKTITKICGFVILSTALSSFFGCAFVSSNKNITPADSRFTPPNVTGTIRSPEIMESSGLAASRCQSNILWTHNDSGDDAFIFAINVRGDVLGTWRVTDARNVDWEDIAAYKDAAGKCWLYIGEIGDNRAKRPEHIVYRVAEPMITTAAASSNRKEPLSTDAADPVRFVYPDFDQDAETLVVHPRLGTIYVVTKRVSGPAGVYRIDPSFGAADTQTAHAVGELSVPAIPNGFVTGGDISPDGKHLMICDYARAYEFDLPSGSAGFDEIFRQSGVPVELGPRKVGEAVCYSADGNSVFATSERKDSPVIEVKRRK